MSTALNKAMVVCTELKLINLKGKILLSALTYHVEF